MVRCCVGIVNKESILLFHAMQLQLFFHAKNKTSYTAIYDALRRKKRKVCIEVYEKHTHTYKDTYKKKIK